MDDASLKEFANLGEDEVRNRVAHNIAWSAEKLRSAREWLEDQRSSRVSKDNAATLAEAKSANELARAANDLAAAANVTAEAAAASARLSAEAAKTNNVIATIALIAAIVAIAMSIVAMFVK